MTPSIRDKDHPSENDTVIMISHTIPLDELIRVAEVLPIDHEDLLKSFSSLSFTPALLKTGKQVSFGGVQSMDYIESVVDLTDEAISDRWFSKQELSDFKQSARELCKSERNGVEIGHDVSTRGMDVYFAGRQRHHQKYIFHVLQALNLHCVGRPDYVATLCEKWSTKVTIKAAERGMQDFYEAYFPHMASGGNAIPHPSVRPNKRAACSDLRASLETTRSL